ncbi:MAG: FeoA family protein [Planctomycetota bacterium]|jgi:ferrous iron transport protein A
MSTEPPPLPPLSTLAVGAWARVVAIEGDPTVRVELLELGIVPGTRIQLQRIAPLGDPLQVRVGRARLALRRAATDLIRIELEL